MIHHDSTFRLNSIRRYAVRQIGLHADRMKPHFTPVHARSTTLLYKLVLNTLNFTPDGRGLRVTFRAYWRFREHSGGNRR